MHDSIRELESLKFRMRLSPIFLGLGVISSAVGIILGLGVANPLTFGVHTVVFLSGIGLVILAFIFSENEEGFASKYSMTHILDIEDKDERYEAYLEHLSDWIASDMEQVNPTRGRGSDPAGPDWGKTDFKLGQEPQRRDAVLEGEKYSGMEGQLTHGEKMVAEANKGYAEMAQKRWEVAEANDPDMIEYGVERLGDLVKTDYFEKNAKEGIFDSVANPPDSD